MPARRSLLSAPPSASTTRRTGQAEPIPNPIDVPPGPCRQDARAAAPAHRQASPPRSPAHAPTRRLDLPRRCDPTQLEAIFQRPPGLTSCRAPSPHRVPVLRLHLPAEARVGSYCCPKHMEVLIRCSQYLGRPIIPRSDGEGDASREASEPCSCGLVAQCAVWPASPVPHVFCADKSKL